MAALGLAVASWTPAQEMVRTGVSGQLEHVVAYFVAGIAFMLAYRDRSPWHFAIALLIYAAVLEAGQLVAPGRRASLYDWAAGAVGVLCATLLVMAWRAAQKRGSTKPQQE